LTLSLPEEHEIIKTAHPIIQDALNRRLFNSCKLN